MTEEAAEDGTERGTERVEAFSDGVFAIAITLLILEVKVPHGTEGQGSVGLLRALLGLWPAYFAYVLSFVMIGIYWANHHYIFRALPAHRPHPEPAQAPPAAGDRLPAVPDRGPGRPPARPS